VSVKPIRNQFADTMLEVGQEDESLVVIVGDISHFILQPFAEACPGRYYNIGICEPAMLSAAAGMSKMGMNPVVHTIAPFIIERSFEQIKLDFCYHKLSGNLITVGSVFDYANLGCTHHCYGDFALIKTLPRTQIVYPASAAEFDSLFRQAYDNEFLTLYRVPGTQHDVEFAPEDIVLGKGIKVREGKDLTVVTTGPHLRTALNAVDTLTAKGFDPEIIHLPTILPLDTELLGASISKTKRVIVIEEHMRKGGVGDDILRAFYDIDGLQYESLSIPDQFVTGYGTYQDLCASVDLTTEGLVARVTESFK